MASGATIGRYLTETAEPPRDVREARWEGVYHHGGAEPWQLGNDLLEAIRKRRGDLGRVAEEVIVGGKPEGWSSLRERRKLEDEGFESRSCETLLQNSIHGYLIDVAGRRLDVFSLDERREWVWTASVAIAADGTAAPARFERVKDAWERAEVAAGFEGEPADVAAARVAFGEAVRKAAASRGIEPARVQAIFRQALARAVTVPAGRGAVQSPVRVCFDASAGDGRVREVALGTVTLVLADRSGASGGWYARDADPSPQASGLWVHPERWSCYADVAREEGVDEEAVRDILAEGVRAVAAAAGARAAHEMAVNERGDIEVFEMRVVVQRVRDADREITLEELLVRHPEMRGVEVAIGEELGLVRDDVPWMAALAGYLRMSRHRQ